jgi:phage repressor protein C with HTH and peptisase S24 domain
MFLRRVVGDSMLPALSPGAIIVAVKARQVIVGDVVVAKLDSREVIKRVAGIDNDAYFLLGDNSEHSSDSRTKGTVVHDQILGRVILPKTRR